MMEKYILGLLILSLFKLSETAPERIGYMQPNGTITKRVGDTIEIYCTFKGNYALNDLKLWFTSKSSLSDKIPEHEIVEVSPNTKMFRIVNAPSMEGDVDCVLNRTGVDRVTINVGTEPKEVIDFKCISYNWDGMNCTFSKPPNPVVVNYTLSYSIAMTRDFLAGTSLCNLRPVMNRKYVCSFSFESSFVPVPNAVPYRQVYDYYFFQLYEENVFGNLTENFTISHYDIMVPNPPESFDTTNITSKSVVLNWKIPQILQNFPKQFVYAINYTIEYDKDKWIQLGPFLEPFNKTTKEHKLKMSHALTNLPYANTWYDYRISLKVKDAADVPEMWSQYKSNVFRTESRIPDQPPLTNIGSFSITDSGHVFIYWKELQRFEHNGPNIKYVVIDSKNTTFTSTRTLAKLEQIHANTLAKSLYFRVHSQNDEGRSIKYSGVRVPAVRERCEPPTLIKKIRLDNKTYNISWVAPKAGPKITSYTIFWCEPNNESPTDCKGSIDFERISSDTLSYQLATENSMNFAISANSDDLNTSSGMIWAMCTVLPGNEINKLTSIITVKVQSTSIEFKWNLACIDQTILTGYILEYCQIKDPKTEECKEPPKSHNISAHAKEYKLEELKPYTTYSVRIRMLSDNNMGPWSDSQVNTTLESAPTPPRNLQAHNITNSSVELTWDQPEAVNGVLVRYEVSYNGKSFSVEKSEGTQRPIVLRKLQSFTEYEVLVRACTGHCSNASAPITFNTSIGIPGTIHQPKVINQQLRWEAPDVPGGRLEYYEVLVVYTNNGEQRRSIKINGTRCTFTDDVRNILVGKLDYSVRAVNVNNSLHFKGDQVNKVKRDLAQKYIELDSDHLKSESNVLKRSSKAEIDAQSKSNNFNHKIEPIHKSNENDIVYKPHTDSAFSLDLNRIKICEEEDDPQLQNYLAADKWPELFPGPYSVTYSTQFNINSKSSGYYFMLVFLVIFTMAFVYGTFFAMKKLKKMQDIKVELPEGLEDIKEESKAKHLDGGITRDEMGHTLDYVTSNEQENDPLVRFRMGPASTSGSDSNSQSEYNEGIDNSIEYEQNTEEDSVRSVSDHGNSHVKLSPPTPLIPVQPSPTHEAGIILNPTPPSPLIRMTTPDNHHLHGSPISSDNHFNSRQFISQTAPISSPLTSNGYVTHEAIIGKPVASSGYTPWSAIDARVQQQHPMQADEMKAKAPIITSSAIQGISGYVTHKQLSDFGQLMH